MPAAALGCGPVKSPPDETRPPAVQVGLPVVDTIVNYEVFTGRTQSVNRVDLRARVTGYLDKVYVGREDEVDASTGPTVREGGDVKKGQILFVLQEKPFRDALNQAEKNLEQLVTQRDFNKRTWDRLRTSGTGTSPNDLDAAETAYRNSESGVGSAKAAAELARQNLDWATIRAPFDGRIGKRLVDRGNDVKADDTILAAIEQINPLYAYFDVDERTTLSIGKLLSEGKVPPDAAGQFPVTLGLANEKPENFAHKGTLKFADNKVDPGTGTLRMWGLFDNAHRDLKSGMFVRVRMGIGAAHETLFVAEAALNSDQGRKYVYVVDDDNSIVYTPVEPGQRKNGLIAVHEQGGRSDRAEADRPDRGGRLAAGGAQMVVAPKEVPMPRATEEGH